MKSLALDIKTAPKPERPIHDKAIFWSSQCGGMKHFPSMEAIVARKTACQLTPLREFVDAVSEAQERVWVIDQYFLNPEDKNEGLQNRIRQILEWMPETMMANDIRILTKSHNTGANKNINNDLIRQFQKHGEWISSRRSKGAGQCEIKLRFTLVQNFDYVHDRFAIVDDELWHFGATVGGFHSQVSAATRGWRASEHGAEDFFNLAWNAEGKMRKRK